MISLTRDLRCGAELIQLTSALENRPCSNRIGRPSPISRRASGTPSRALEIAVRCSCPSLCGKARKGSGRDHHTAFAYLPTPAAPRAWRLWGGQRTRDRPNRHWRLSLDAIQYRSCSVRICSISAVASMASASPEVTSTRSQNLSARAMILCIPMTEYRSSGLEIQQQVAAEKNGMT